MRACVVVLKYFQRFGWVLSGDFRILRFKAAPIEPFIQEKIGRGLLWPRRT